MEPLELPSNVTDRKFVCLPQGNVIDSDDEWERCGKWMMPNFDPDMSTFVDKAWLALRPLVEDGTLILLKASTPLMKAEGGTLICYTRPGKEAARRAAEAIRRAVDYRALLHYKANKLTAQGIARRKGHNSISMYMHTYRGRFYVRDLLGRWTRDDKEDRRLPLVSQPNCLDYAESEILPSESQETSSTLGCSEGLEVAPNWYLRCSLYRKNGKDLAEADRVWIVAKRLLHEGACNALFWRKDAESVEIRLYVIGISDVKSWLMHCDRIFEDAQVNTIMYFTEGNEAKIYLEEPSDKNVKYYTKIKSGRKVFYKESADEIVYCTKKNQAKVLHSHKYTPDGELYENIKTIEAFVL